MWHLSHSSLLPSCLLRLLEVCQSLINDNEERVCKDKGNWPSGRNKQRGTLHRLVRSCGKSRQLKEDAKKQRCITEGVGSSEAKNSESELWYIISYVCVDRQFSTPSRSFLISKTVSFCLFDCLFVISGANLVILLLCSNRQ